MGIAVLVPCYNEEQTVATVVRDFRNALPGATVYVYDNNSRDSTVERAQDAGAVVRKERLQGKGNVVRRMFADIDADIYVLVDGDATYDAHSAIRMVHLLASDRLDMVTGVRVGSEEHSYRPGHRFGNALLSGTVSFLFDNRCTDMLSGYRVFSRRFVKSFPALSCGFETETELTIHALELALPIAEVQTAYGARPENSTTKLNTYRDGWRIFSLIMTLYRNERPLLFFGVIAILLGLISFVLGVPVVLKFVETGLVPRLPSAVLATGLGILACLSLATGLILDTVTRGRRELKRIAYLRIGSELPRTSAVNLREPYVDHEEERHGPMYAARTK